MAKASYSWRSSTNECWNHVSLRFIIQHSSMVKWNLLQVGCRQVRRHSARYLPRASERLFRCATGEICLRHKLIILIIPSSQMCPHKRAFVLEHGIVGDDPSTGSVYVSCKFLKFSRHCNFISAPMLNIPFVIFFRSDAQT